MINKISKILVLSFFLSGCMIVIFAWQGVNIIFPEKLREISIVKKPEKVLKKYENIKAPILIYHHIRELEKGEIPGDYTVSIEQFKKQMNFLKNSGFETILLSDFIDCFDKGCFLPEKPVILTFDDGLKNQFENALPILENLDFKASFYIFPSAISQNDRYVNWEELKILKDKGMEIGTHGYYHKFLTKVDGDVLKKELVDSKEKLEQNLDINIVGLAYPFGDFDDRIIQEVENNEYEYARTIYHGQNHSKKDLYKLRAYIITNDFNYFKNIID